MSAVAMLRAIRPPQLAPVAPFHVYPKIVLEHCGYCVAGRVRYVANGRIVDQQCTHCAGHGTVAVEA